MIALIIQSYFNLFLVVGLVCLAIFSLGLYWIFKQSLVLPETQHDFSVIAGDDVIATQLDLARAYIETNNKQIARQLLNVVLLQGTVSQKNEARTLMSMI